MLWKQLDQAYFTPPTPEQLKQLGDLLDQSNKEASAPSLALFSPKMGKFLEKKLNKGTFESELDYSNLLKHFYVTSRTEALLLLFCQKKIAFCETCENNLSQTFQGKFNYPITKKLNEEAVTKMLRHESFALDKLIRSKSLGFCDSCLSKLDHRGSYLKKSQSISAGKISKNSEISLKTSKKIEQLIRSSQAEMKQVPDPFTFALMTQTKLDYLLSTLVKIEYKIIAENIRFVIGRNERGILVSLMTKGPMLYFDEQLLTKLNTIRENSLFKFHKCGFKSHNYYYTHNKYNFSVLKDRESLTDELITMNRTGFRELKAASTTSKLTDSEFICHHCKYVGKEPFFLVCTNRQFDLKKNDPDHWLKYMFTFDTEAEGCCDRAYCAYCVRNFYNMDVKKETFICPFCLSRCYCPTCDYRDFYIRIFSQFLELGGSKEQLLRFSPIQKIANEINRWEKHKKSPSNSEKSSEISSQVGKNDLRLTRRKTNDSYTMCERDKKFFRKQKDEIDRMQAEFAEAVKLRQNSVMLLELSRLVVKREELKKNKLIEKIAGVNLFN